MSSNTNNTEARDNSLLQKKIGYTFKSPEILEVALTHSSYANESKNHGKKIKYNERLEFLGDSVLSIIASEYLFLNHPELPEGKMSTIRSGAVCEKALASFAADIELGEYIRFGLGEAKSGGRTRPSILADAFEALLAAIYLDGGMEKVKKFALPYLSKTIQSEIDNDSAVDAKTKLQQIIQGEEGEELSYVVVGEDGPSHKRVFTIEARLNSNVIGRGTAGSKRAAEQLAAAEALTLFGEKTNE